ncbi:ATP-binding protein [Pseudomonas sp. HS-18]|uniref:sensor histidine kinase n=1 Tax=Pseudomonas sp. HS-18 TaxID=2879114 RepID=UPI001CF07F3E|nr:ATP-binding protein [Pseudomonas sp. HS-18]UCL85732.1 ATP-binding protein [Pseudomonas sp. HS-18]
MESTEEEQGAVFRPRARIMKTLGEELISSDTVAIIELVKNAYDADAKKVLIKFSEELVAGAGGIEVIDNGVGMNLATIRSAWMQPATPSKKNNKNSPDGSRRVLGEKGVGRFAAARLATSLRLESRKAGDAKESYAYFDWTQFDDENLFLDEVRIETREREPEVIVENSSVGPKGFFSIEGGAQGTVLSMGGLRNSWDEMGFLALQRGLSRLVSPFSEIGGFDIEISAPKPFEKFSRTIEPPQAVKYPHYTVSGFVDKAGMYDLTFNVVASGNPVNLKGRIVPVEEGRWDLIDVSHLSESDQFRSPECGPLNIELRIWDRDDLGNIVQMVKSSISNVRKDLDAFAGVNIYRDGFRVLPYGEPNNDWLRLDLRRVQNPSLRISNNQIFGYVQITADGNSDLQDQSNREGLRENQAYFDLREIMISILSRMETYRRHYKKNISSEKTEKDESKQPGLFEPLDFDGIKGHLAEKQDSVALGLVEKVERDFQKKISEIKSVIARYHGLATLGQLIDRLLHQGRHPLAKIVGYSTLGLESAEKLNKKGDESPFLIKSLERFKKILEQSAVLDGVFKRIEPFGGRRRGKPAQLYLEKLIRNSYDVLEEDFQRLQVKFDAPSSETLVSIDSSEFQEVMVNLLQNSLYWLRVVPPESRVIAISVRRNESGAIEIIVADSGPGIPWENRELIFEPYFTTKSDGVGLGLSIVGDIVTDYYGGSLELMDSNPLGGAAFRITLKRRV